METQRATLVKVNTQTANTFNSTRFVFMLNNDNTGEER